MTILWLMYFSLGSYVSTSLLSFKNQTIKCLSHSDEYNQNWGLNSKKYFQNLSCMAVFLDRPWDGRGSITWAPRLSALVGIGEGVFVLLIVCKSRSDMFCLQRERSGVLIHGEGIWKSPKIKSSAPKIGLKASEKLETKKMLSVFKWSMQAPKTPCLFPCLSSPGTDLNTHQRSRKLTI